MKKILILFIIIFQYGCSSEPSLAGSMSESSVCTTSGYIIKKAMSDKTEVYQWPCSAKNTGGATIEVESGYKTPLMQSPFRYTARGYVDGNTLNLIKIRVHGIDEEFIRFCEFGFNATC